MIDILSKRRRIGGKIIYYDLFVDAGIDISSGWRLFDARMRHIHKFGCISRPLLVETFQIDIRLIFVYIDAGVDTLVRVHLITR